MVTDGEESPAAEETTVSEKLTSPNSSPRTNPTSQDCKVQSQDQTVPTQEQYVPCQKNKWGVNSNKSQTKSKSRPSSPNTNPGSRIYKSPVKRHYKSQVKFRIKCKKCNLSSHVKRKSRFRGTSANSRPTNAMSRATGSNHGHHVPSQVQVKTSKSKDKY